GGRVHGKAEGFFTVFPDARVGRVEVCYGLTGMDAGKARPQSRREQTDHGKRGENEDGWNGRNSAGGRQDRGSGVDNGGAQGAGVREQGGSLPGRRRRAGVFMRAELVGQLEQGNRAAPDPARLELEAHRRNRGAAAVESAGADSADPGGGL